MYNEKGKQNTHSKRKEHEKDSEPSSRIQSRARDIVELGPPGEILLPYDILENEPHQEERSRVDPRRRGSVKRIREPDRGKDLGRYRFGASPRP